MKTIKDYLLLEGNKHINGEVTPDNFNEHEFTSKQSALLKHLLKDYKQNLTFIYVVDGDKPSNNLSEYFGTLIPKDERGILYIEYQSTTMGSPKEAIFYNTSKIKERKEKSTYIYSYHKDGGSKFKSAVLTTDDNENTNVKLSTEPFKH
jgi:hypothetical protein